jgi:quercetin dioxygenase-like cupin family protein
MAPACPGDPLTVCGSAASVQPRACRACEEAYMTPYRSLLSAAAATAAILALSPAWSADTAGDTMMVNPASIQWQDAPPSVPKGAKIAVMHGDPGKSGPYTMRLRLPAGYKIPPHTHTQSENLTVLSGALYLGMGDKVDQGNAKALNAGGFHFLPGKTPHYAYTKAATVLQVHGEGPFDINYLNPADDPSKMAAKQ